MNVGARRRSFPVRNRWIASMIDAVANEVQVLQLPWKRTGERIPLDRQFAAGGIAPAIVVVSAKFRSGGAVSDGSANVRNAFLNPDGTLTVYSLDITAGAPASAARASISALRAWSSSTFALRAAVSARIAALGFPSRAATAA